MPSPAALQARLAADRVSAAEADRAQPSQDRSARPALLSDLAAWPVTTAEASADLCSIEAGWLCVGAGSSQEGKPIPVHGGPVLTLTRMNRSLAAHQMAREHRAGAPAVISRIKRALDPQGILGSGKGLAQ